MVMQALCGVELAMRDVGVPFEPGAGAGAAVRYLSDTGQPMRIAAEHFSSLKYPESDSVDVGGMRSRRHCRQHPTHIRR